MSQFPQDPKKIRARITRYRRALRKEQEAHGFIHDGYGKRYLLGPLYLLVGDVEGALQAYEWFDETFPDDVLTTEGYSVFTTLDSELQSAAETAVAQGLEPAQGVGRG